MSKTLVEILEDRITRLEQARAQSDNTLLTALRVLKETARKQSEAFMTAQYAFAAAVDLVNAIMTERDRGVEQ